MRTGLLFLGALVLLAFVPLAVSGYVIGLLTFAWYFGVFAMSWDLLFGYAGEVNFGPTFLIGLGAYGGGLLNTLLGWPVPAAVLGGAGIAVVGGLLLAVPALRLSGPYFGLVTLVAVLLLQQGVTIGAHWTGGEIGLALDDVLSIDERVNYWIALGFMGVAGVVLLGYSRSPAGLILQACGQDRVQAGALGFNVAKHKVAAFCLSALFSGLSGAMLVFYYGTVSPGTVVDIAVGVQVIIAAVLGGRRTIVGAVIGAAFLVVVGEQLRPLGQLSTLVVSGVALAAILFFPDGLLGLVRRLRRV